MPRHPISDAEPFVFRPDFHRPISSSEDGAPAPLAPTHPDGKLIALGREFDQAAAEACRLDGEYDVLYRRAWDQAPAPPELCPRESDRPMLRDAGVEWPEARYGVLEAHCLRKRVDFFAANDLRAPWPIERAREIIDAITRRDSEHERAFGQLGGPAVDSLRDAAFDRVVELGKLIVQTPASTIEGLAVKARCHEWCVQAGYDEIMIGSFNDQVVKDSMLVDCLGLVQPPPTDPTKPAAATVMASEDAAA